MTDSKKWLNPDHIRLMAGEMTAAEMRCVLAVVRPLVAELDAARLDAGRDRWLRKQHWSEAEISALLNPKKAVKSGHCCPSLKILDGLVYAEMSQEKPA